MAVKSFRRLAIGCFSICVLAWLWPFAAWGASGTAFYDPMGNRITAEQYRLLTDGPRQPDDSSALPEAWQIFGEPYEADPAPSEEQKPAAGKESPAPAALSGSSPAAPVAKEPADKPVSPQKAPAGKKSAVPAEPAASRSAAGGGQETTDTGPDNPPHANSSVGEENAPETREEAAAVRANIVSDTLFRTFQRDTEKQNDVRVLPLYDYLRVDLAGMEDKGFSLHLYGWGRIDLNDSRFYNDNPDGELLYGYLQYSRPDYGLNLKLGRQHVFKGIINSSIDGLGLESALTPYFGIALYGGLPVALSDDGYSGDAFWGGRISHHLGTQYEIGLSYKLENSDGETDGEMMGIDLTAALPGVASVYGLSAYNLRKHGWAQHLLEAGFDLSKFHFRPFYQRYSYDEFFNTRDNSAAPFRFLAGTDEILTVFGSDIRWQGLGSADLGAKVIHYGYDQRDDDAMYYEGDLTWYLSSLTQVGGQIGRMDGGSPETAYFQARLFFYWNKPLKGTPLGFLAGDIIYVLYDQEIFGKDHSLFLSLGGGVKFLGDRLELKLSADYSNDPYFDSDVRGLLLIKYNIGK